jgi:outer membrane protein insertion porin family
VVSQWLGELREKTFIRQFGAGAGRGVAAPGSVARIEIKHVGPATVPEAQIRSLLRAKVGEPVTQPCVDRDIRNLFATGDFHNIRVTAAEADGGFTLTYVVQERPKLSDIQFTGNKALSSDALLPTLTSKIGQRLDGRKVFNDTLAIRGLYRKAGLPAATVKSVLIINEESGEGGVNFEIAEKP